MEIRCKTSLWTLALAMHSCSLVISGMPDQSQGRLNAKTGHGEWAGLVALEPTSGCVVAGGVEERTALLDTLRRSSCAFAE